MRRLFLTIAVLAMGALGVAMVTGQMDGAIKALFGPSLVGRNGVPAMAVGYGLLGVTLGVVLTVLSRIRWGRPIRFMIAWLRGRRNSFEMFVLACGFAAVIVFY